MEYKYLITFRFGTEELIDELNSDEPNVTVTLNRVKDDPFVDAFSTKENIKDFENWYNDGIENEDELIHIIDIKYDFDDVDAASITVITSSEIKDDSLFMDSIFEFVEEFGKSKISYHESGYIDEIGWNYRANPLSTTRNNIDDDYEEEVDEFFDVSIKQI